MEVGNHFSKIEIRNSKAVNCFQSCRWMKFVRAHLQIQNLALLLHLHNFTNYVQE